MNNSTSVVNEILLGTWLRHIHIIKIIKNIFSAILPNMVQNNMLSTKIKIKKKWIKSNWIQKYERPLYLKNVGTQCLFSKGERVFGRLELETETVSEKEVIKSFHSF